MCSDRVLTIKMKACGDSVREEHVEISATKLDISERRNKIMKSELMESL